MKIRAGFASDQAVRRPIVAAEIAVRSGRRSLKFSTGLRPSSVWPALLIEASGPTLRRSSGLEAGRGSGDARYHCSPIYVQPTIRHHQQGRWTHRRTRRYIKSPNHTSVQGCLLFRSGHEFCSNRRLRKGLSSGKWAIHWPCCSVSVRAGLFSESRPVALRRFADCVNVRKILRARCCQLGGYEVVGGNEASRQSARRVDNLLNAAIPRSIKPIPGMAVRMSMPTGARPMRKNGPGSVKSAGVSP